MNGIPSILMYVLVCSAHLTPIALLILFSNYSKIDYKLSSCTELGDKKQNDCV